MKLKTAWPVLTLFLFVLCWGSTALFAQDEGQEAPGKDLQLVLRHAYVNNPSLKVARSELLAIYEELPQAYAGWKPSLTSSGSVTVTDIEGSNFGTANGSTAKDIVFNLEQPLYRGGRTSAQVMAARHTIRASSELLRAREQDILQAAVTAYMDVVRDESLLKLAQNNAEVIGKELEASRGRFTVGEVTKTDVSQAEARSARAESDVITAQGTLNASKAVFEQIIGLPAEDLADMTLPIQVPQDLTEATQIAEEKAPQVLSAVSAHKAAEEDVDNVFGELLPEVGLFGQWNRTLDPSPGLIDEQTTKSIGISASIPLYQGGAVRSRVRAAKHTANQRYMEILEVKRQIRQNVVENWADLKAAESEIRSRELQVKASAIAQEGVRKEQELGARTVLDALDADQELLDAQVALVTAKRNQVVAKFSLLATLGLLSPETLGFPEEMISMDPYLDGLAWRIFGTDVDRLAGD